MIDKPINITRRGLLPLSLASMLALAQEKENFIQEPEEGHVDFATGVKIVNLLATVRDKQGKPLPGLTKDNFIVEEDGKRQEIQYFSKESNQPLTLGFLVDVSGAMRTYIPAERNATYRFINRILREDQDQAFIFRFYRNVELMSFLSNSRAKLETALAKLEDPPPATKGNFQYQVNGMFYGSAIFNSLYIAADTVMRKQTGRKALILMSDGEDTGSTSTVTSAIEAAQRADTIIYTLGFYDQSAINGLGGQGGAVQRPGRAVMTRLAQETGGRYFDTTSTMTVDQIFDAIQEELRHQYSLGYTPTNSLPGYRKIKITVKDNKGASVQAREGYYSGDGPDEAQKRKINSKAKF
ncbi:MAG: VWA domain-containing protein [Acidobacteriota bacterium]